MHDSAAQVFLVDPRSSDDISYIVSFDCRYLILNSVELEVEYATLSYMWGSSIVVRFSDQLAQTAGELQDLLRAPEQIE